MPDGTCAPPDLPPIRPRECQTAVKRRSAFPCGQMGEVVLLTLPTWLCADFASQRLDSEPQRDSRMKPVRGALDACGVDAFRFDSLTRPSDEPVEGWPHDDRHVFEESERHWVFHGQVQHFIGVG